MMWDSREHTRHEIAAHFGVSVQTIDRAVKASFTATKSGGREVMRVLCSGLDGSDIEGEVIGGEFYDPDTGCCDLEETFTVRDDDGEFFQVHGWMVDVAVLETRRLVM